MREVTLVFGIAKTTMKTHLRRVFEKVRTGRQPSGQSRFACYMGDPADVSEWHELDQSGQSNDVR